MWLVAINPTSGNGRGARVAARAVSILTDWEVKFTPIQAESADELANALHENISQHQIDGIIAIGGDGLAHCILQVVTPLRIPFAIIPAGTGNDFVRTLGWPLDDIEPLLRRVISSKPQAIDLGRVDGRWFGAILSTGFDSVVNERANALRWPKGPARYNVAIALELPRFKPIEYQITCDDQSFTTEAMLVAIGNGRSYGGGMNICPNVDVHDGLFDVVILEPVNTFEFIRTFPKVYSGTHINHPKVRTLRASAVSIEADAVAYADGERIGAAPLSAECISEAGLTWIR